MSMRPNRRAASAMAAASVASRVTSASNATHSPAPPCATMAAVSSAEASRLSTASTRAPSCAKRSTVARPLPMPSPGDCPAPTTIATLSLRRMGISRAPVTLETQIAHHIPALVLEHIGALQPLERGLGILVAECGGPFVIGFGGGLVLRAAAPDRRERAHALERAGVVLRGGLLEQRTRRGLVLRPAGPVGGHQAELILRLRRVRFRALGQQRARLDRIGGRAAEAARKPRQICHSPRIAALRAARDEGPR